MTDAYVKTTLHCIGVCVISKEVGPCMLMMESTAQASFYCVSLTRETSDLVSPLYEHTLLLQKKQPPTSPTSLLALFCDASYFVVHERLSTRCRLAKQYTKTELEKELTKLVGQTLFMDIDCSYSGKEEDFDRELLCPLFTTSKSTYIRYAYWQCEEEEDCALLRKYLEAYHDLCKKRTSARNKKSLYIHYWEVVTPFQKASLDDGLKKLLMFAPKKDKLYQMVDVIALFNDWTQYKAVSPYFKHLLQEMPLTYALHKFLAPEPKLVDKLWVMPTEQRVVLHSFLCVFLKNYATNSCQITDEKAGLGLFDRVLTGHLYTVIKIYVGQHQEPSTQDTLLERLKYPLLTHYVMQRLEAHALSKVGYSKGIMEPITIENIYNAYIGFTDQTPKVLDPEYVINTEETFPLASGDDSDSEEMTVEIDCYASSLEDFGHFVRHLIKQVQERKPEKWHLKKNKSSLLKMKGVVFFITPSLTLLELEKKNVELYHDQLSGYANFQFRLYSNEPIEARTWQEEWREFRETTEGQTQQYQFMLFTPLEILKNADVASIFTMFMNGDIYNTSILLEKGDNFFLERLTRYFFKEQKDIKMPKFHRDHCFSSREFQFISDKAVKETIIVPQCHTLSLAGMYALFQWLLWHRATIKRVVLLGSPFIMPCKVEGQAFLDLMRSVVPDRIGDHMFKREIRNGEFNEILKKYWRILKLDQEAQLTSTAYLEKQKLYNEGGCRILHYVKSEALFLAALGPIKIQIISLNKNGYDPSVKAIENALNNKQKTWFSLSAGGLPIDDLCIHNPLLSLSVKPVVLDVFVITSKVLQSLDKNQLLYLFMLLEKLYVIESADAPINGDLFATVCEVFASRPRPNQRYSYVDMCK